MLHRFRFVIAGIVIILVNQVVTFAVSASMPDALLAGRHHPLRDGLRHERGQCFRRPGWVDMPGMIKYITHPHRPHGGRHGHLLRLRWNHHRPALVCPRALIRDAVASHRPTFWIHGYSWRCHIE